MYKLDLELDKAKSSLGKKNDVYVSLAAIET